MHPLDTYDGLIMNHTWYLIPVVTVYICACVCVCVSTQSIETLFSQQFDSYQYHYLISTCTSTHPRDWRTYSSPGSRCHFHCRRSLACWSWHGEPWSAVVSVCQAWWCPRPPLGCSAGWLDPPSPLQGNICAQWDNKDLNQLILPCCSPGMVLTGNIVCGTIFKKKGFMKRFKLGLFIPNEVFISSIYILFGFLNRL